MEEQFMPDCCPIWPQLAWLFKWIVSFDDDYGQETASMPYVVAPNDDRQRRINFCPSCGVPRRDVVMSRERLADLIF